MTTGVSDPNSHSNPTQSAFHQPCPLHGGASPPRSGAQPTLQHACPASSASSRRAPSRGRVTWTGCPSRRPISQQQAGRTVRRACGLGARRWSSPGTRSLQGAPAPARFSGASASTASSRPCPAPPATPTLGIGTCGHGPPRPTSRALRPSTPPGAPQVLQQCLNTSQDRHAKGRHGSKGIIRRRWSRLEEQARDGAHSSGRAGTPERSAAGAEASEA